MHPYLNTGQTLTANSSISLNLATLYRASGLVLRPKAEVGVVGTKLSTTSKPNSDIAAIRGIKWSERLFNNRIFLAT